MSDPDHAPARRLLLLQCRNFGDAVIGTGLVEALGRSGLGLDLQVLTRPRFRALYANNPHVAAVHEAEFPIGTAKQFGPRQALDLLGRIAGLRRRHFDRVVNLHGDFRENLLGRAIGAADNCGPLWLPGHPHRRLVRQGLSGLLDTAVPMPPDPPGMYAAAQRLAQALGATAPARQRLYDARGQVYVHRPGGKTIGLHPSSSLPCKEWPVPRWRALIGAMRERGWPVLLFGAPAERERLGADFEGLLGQGVELATGDTGEFFARLTELAAFVGLDSFGIHAACAVGTPSLMLNGAMLAELIRPPEAMLIDGGPGLPCHPCFNRPTCTREASPYRCIRDIAVPAVMQQLAALLAGGGR